MMKQEERARVCFFFLRMACVCERETTRSEVCVFWVFFCHERQLSVRMCARECLSERREKRQAPAGVSCVSAKRRDEAAQPPAAFPLNRC